MLCVPSCLCPLYHEKWLLVGNGGGTRITLMVASLGSPIPSVFAARVSSCGLQHQRALTPLKALLAVVKP